MVLHLLAAAAGATRVTTLGRFHPCLFDVDALIGMGAVAAVVGLPVEGLWPGLDSIC